VDDEDLLKQKCQLHQIIPFEGSWHLSSRPGSPNLGIVEPVRGVIPEML
jgi:hypothetical protein